jgi:hypothetical protein
VLIGIIVAFSLAFAQYIGHVPVRHGGSSFNSIQFNLHKSFVDKVKGCSRQLWQIQPSAARVASQRSDYPANCGATTVQHSQSWTLCMA